MLQIWVDGQLQYVIAEGTVKKMTKEQWEEFKRKNEPIRIDEGWLVVRNDEDMEIIITEVGKYRFGGYIYYKKEQQLYKGTILPPASRHWGIGVMRVDEKGNWYELTSSPH